MRLKLSAMFTTACAAAVLAALCFVSPAHAQGPPPGGHAFTPSPQMQAQFQAWRKWRDNHKHVEALQETLRGIDYIDSEPDTKLTPAQAKTILAVIDKWKTKPAISDDQALVVEKQITKPLTVAQLKRIAAQPRIHRGPGGGGGFGGPRPGAPGAGSGFGGPPPPGGLGGAPFTMPAPRDYNPLNPSTMPIPRMQQRAQQRMDALIADLQAKAK